MKVIVTEDQIKKFHREVNNLNYNKVSKAIEQLAKNYIGEENLCDIICYKSSGLDEMYVLLVLFNGPSSYNLDTKVDKFIKSMLDVKMFTLIKDTECND